MSPPPRGLAAAAWVLILAVVGTLVTLGRLQSPEEAAETADAGRNAAIAAVR